jgi:hypothetical protein
MEYKILVVLSNIFFVAAGWYLGRDSGRKATLKALDDVLDRIIDDVEKGNSLDWARQDSKKYK